MSGAGRRSRRRRDRGGERVGRGRLLRGGVVGGVRGLVGGVECVFSLLSSLLAAVIVVGMEEGM